MKKIIALLLGVFMITSMLTPVFADGIQQGETTNHNIVESDLKDSNEYQTNGGPLLGIVKRAAQSFLIDKLSELPIFWKSYSFNDYGDWFNVTYDSIKFNHGDIGPHIIKEMKAYGGDTLELQMDKVSWGGTKNVSCRIEMNGQEIRSWFLITDDVPYETIIPGTPDVEKDITIHYIVNDSEIWTPYIRYVFNFAGGGPGGDVPYSQQGPQD